MMDCRAASPSEFALPVFTGTGFAGMTELSFTLTFRELRRVGIEVGLAESPPS